MDSAAAMAREAGVDRLAWAVAGASAERRTVEGMGDAARVRGNGRVMAVSCKLPPREGRRRRAAGNSCGRPERADGDTA
ncbi:hypothetical protein BAU08_21650 [Bordetella bronchialis]|uniref:Uncharacterized protein n=1 Tax=Bordetella bronchialis TaxID=463025 RepID=A0A193G314_9BORD|nr:hypothetical protein BAU08_21650 [Bordetella bronchialis]